MGLMSDLRQSIAGMMSSLFSNGETKRIAVYGPPNAGKTTLANQIIDDWADDTDRLGETSDLEHETQSVNRREEVTISADAGEVTIDIIDTPGVTTEVNWQDFEDELDKDEAIERSRGATEGVAEAMGWLQEDDVDGVIYMLDSTEDPFSQVNTMMTGILESKNLDTVILANKIDLEDSNLEQVRRAFPQHETIGVSAKYGDNLEESYDLIAETFS